MAALTNKEIEELQEQLQKTKKEMQEIYQKLAEAGVAELADDFLDDVTGGARPMTRLR